MSDRLFGALAFLLLAALVVSAAACDHYVWRKAHPDAPAWAWWLDSTRR